MKKSERKWPNTDVTEIDWLINVVTNGYKATELTCWVLRAKDSEVYRTYEEGDDGPGLCVGLSCISCALEGEGGLAEWLGISVEELEKCRKKK